MSSREENLRRRAIDVLDKNWRGSSTIPSFTLYPHQWSWDSGFIAIGLSHFNQERAQQELLSLFDGQWLDGRVPHIRFSQEVPENAYFPGPSFWNSLESSGLEGVKSSGLIQPAVHARAALDVYKNSADKASAREFLKDIYPKLVASHNYLLNNRVHPNSQLAYIVHPWESGLDNSPYWDDVLAKVPVDNELWKTFQRRDIDQINPAQRPSNDDYSRYIRLALRYRDEGYHDTSHLDSAEFVVLDPLFNAVLAWSEEALAGIALAIGLDSDIHEKRATQLVAALIDELFDSELGIFIAKDLKSNQPIRKITAAGLAPIVLSHLSLQYVKVLENCLLSKHFKITDNNIHGVASYDLSGSEFDSKLYWRGPVWLNTSWLVWRGLMVHGSDEIAKPLADRLIALVEEKGFFEYFDPITGEGYGTPEFSWTAALIIDLLDSGS